MLIVSPNTAHALAPHAGARSFVMFVQVTPPSGMPGPILIEGVKGSRLPGRLWELVRDNAFDPMLIGLLETAQPEQASHELRTFYEQDRLHDGWFDPTPQLLTYIHQSAQAVLHELLAQMQPGALPEQPVTIDEMARMLNITVKMLRRLVEKKQIPHLRLGRALRFVPKDVIASLQQQPVP